MNKFKAGDKVVRLPLHILSGKWAEICEKHNIQPNAIVTVAAHPEARRLTLDGFGNQGDDENWNSKRFRLATGLEVQCGHALPAEDHIKEKEAHVECVRNLLDAEKARVQALENEVADLKAQLELAKTLAAESNDQRDAAVIAAKSLGEQVQHLLRDARHKRYDQRKNQHRAQNIISGLAAGLDDIDLDGLVVQLTQIADICDEQGNGADAKLCAEAASALAITIRAVDDWNSL